MAPIEIPVFQYEIPVFQKAPLCIVRLGPESIKAGIEYQRSYVYVGRRPAAMGTLEGSPSPDARIAEQLAEFELAQGGQALLDWV